MKHLTLILCAALLPAQVYQNRATVREGASNLCGTASGTNTITCAMSPAIAGYVVGNDYTFVAAGANTGAATLNINSRGAVAIKKNGDAALVANDIKTGQVVTVRYDGTNFQMVSHLGNASAGGSSTISAPYVLLHATGGASNSVISGTANTGICHRFGLQAQHAFTGLALEVTVASGTCGGTCGFGVAVYNSAKDSKLGQTAIMTSGGSPNFNTTGAKLLTWASGANVSAGTLTLAAGTYYACYSTDSTAANFPMINVDLGTAENGTNPGPHHGYQAAFTTGSGASLAFPSTLSGTFNATSTGGQVIPMVFVP